MDDKMKSVLDKVLLLSKQNLEFDEELRKGLEVTSSASGISIDDNINQIYEYCIEKVLRKQAKEFYKDFPLTEIVLNLENDFVRMAAFQRKDNFGDFCLALYQQLECITNTLCESKLLNEIAGKMWGYPAYVKTEWDKENNCEKPLLLSERSDSSTFTIAALVFPGQNKKTGLPYSVEKSKSSLQSLYAADKMRCIVYFVGYGTLMRASDYNNYKEFVSLLTDIYLCRNMNHRGNTLNQWEQDTLNRIEPLKSFYFFKYLGVLSQYVEYIKLGMPKMSDLETFTKTLVAKKIEVGPKVLGKIDLKDDGKKRSKK